MSYMTKPRYIQKLTLKQKQPKINRKKEINRQPLQTEAEKSIFVLVKFLAKLRLRSESFFLISFL